MGPLTENQVLKYHEDGYLLASGLIPEAVARRGEDAVWEVMEMDRSDPNTWSHRPEEALESGVNAGVTPKSNLYQYFGNKHPDLLACYGSLHLSGATCCSFVQQNAQACIKCPEPINSLAFCPLPQVNAKSPNRLIRCPRENRPHIADL